MNDLNFIQYLFDNKYPNKEYFCEICHYSCILRTQKRNQDHLA